MLRMGSIARYGSFTFDTTSLHLRQYSGHICGVGQLEEDMKDCSLFLTGLFRS